MCSPTLMEPRFRSSVTLLETHPQHPNLTLWGIWCLGIVVGWALLPLVSLSCSSPCGNGQDRLCCPLQLCAQGSSLGISQMTDQGHLASELVAETPGSIRANIRDAPWSDSPGLEGLQSSSACEVHVTLSFGMFPALHQ